MIITHKHYHIVYADTVLPLKEKHIATVVSFLNYKKIKVYGIKKI